MGFRRIVIFLILLGLPFPSAHALSMDSGRTFTLTRPKIKLSKGTASCAVTVQGKLMIGTMKKRKNRIEFRKATSSKDKKMILKKRLLFRCQQEAIARGLVPPPATPVQSCTMAAANPLPQFPVQENSSISIAATSLVTTTCTGTFGIVISSAPLHGAATVAPELGTVQYQPALHYRGPDTLMLEVSHPQASAPVQIAVAVTVTARAAEFAGQTSLLAPYRATLTRREARLFLKRVALGDERVLAQFPGDGEIDRAALVEALINFNPGNGVESFATQLATETRNRKTGFPTIVEDGWFWERGSAQFHWSEHLLHGNPLRELMLLHLHDHFAASLQAVREPDQISMAYAVRDHYEKLRAYAFGNIPGFMHTLTYDMAMGWFLSNNVNHFIPGATGADFRSADGNLNYGREVLEKFTIGRFDLYTGAPNYTENDVRASANILSGFYSWFPSYRGYACSEDTNYNGVLDPGEDRYPVVGGVPTVNHKMDLWECGVGSVGFNGWNVRCAFPQSHYPDYFYQVNFDRNNRPCEGMNMFFDKSIAVATPQRIFEGGTEQGAPVTALPSGPHEFSPRTAPGSGESTSPEANRFFDLLLYQHPATSRRIAYSFFGRFAQPHPSPEITAALASHLLATDYDIRSMLRQILNSSAMFTMEAMYGVIKSPAEHLTYCINRLKLPMTKRHTRAFFLEALAESGLDMFAPATVFGWGLGGDPVWFATSPETANYGQVWLSLQSILNRGRGIWKIIADQQRTTPLYRWFGQGMLNEPGDGVDLRESLYGPWTGAPTAAAVVDRALERFQLEVGASQRLLLIDLLEGRAEQYRRPNPGQPEGLDNRSSWVAPGSPLYVAAPAWNPADNSLVQSRLRALAWVLSMHPKSIL